MDDLNNLDINPWITESDLAIADVINGVNNTNDTIKLIELLEQGKQLESKLNTLLKKKPIERAKVIDVMIVIEQIDKLNNLITKKDNVLRPKIINLTKNLISLLQHNILEQNSFKISINKLEKIKFLNDSKENTERGEIQFNVSFKISDNIIKDCEISISRNTIQ